MKAYPVRTPLSRVLTEGAAGVVDVLTRLDPTRDDWVPADVEKSAQAAIAGLKLARGGKLNFAFRIADRARLDDRNRNQTRERVRGLARRWAEEHGLELGSFSY